MSYTEDITRALIDTLSRTANAPIHLLAGHVPNLPFWIAEVNHALAVIAGYPERFDKMVAAEEEFALWSAEAAKRRATGAYLNGSPRMAMTLGTRSQLSRELIETAGSLIARCLASELISPIQADRLRKSISTAGAAAR